MTARAYVETDIRRLDLVAIHLQRKFNDGQVDIAKFEDVEWARNVDPASVIDEPAPLRLTEDEARALYEALARHFGGAPDMAQLRADYNDERKRVDRLIGFLAPRT